MVGSVREVVQRALKTLEHAGVIQMTRRRIRIIDVDGLNLWSESESRGFDVSAVPGTRSTNRSTRRRHSQTLRSPPMTAELLKDRGKVNRRNHPYQSCELDAARRQGTATVVTSERS